VVRVLVVALGALLAACSSGNGHSDARSTTSATVGKQVNLWPAPSDPMARAKAAGLQPETAERLEHHVHSHLDVFVDGKHVIVPAGIGITIDDPAVHDFTILGAPGYGGIDPPCDQPCISPLHTHDISGILHTESATDVDNTLGQFFVEWGVRLDNECVGNYCRPGTKVAFVVDGAPFTGDPRTIDLSDRREIAIVIGTPPAKVPAVGDFSQI
jgi:hypothetical protein